MCKSTSLFKINQLCVCVCVCVWFHLGAKSFQIFGHQNITLNLILLTPLLIIHPTQIENSNMLLLRVFFLRNDIKALWKNFF